MSFITDSDFDAAIHAEILGAITRGDQDAVNLAVQMAIDEMTGILSTRYDCSALFSATGTNRSTIMVMCAIDITLYHLHSAYNPIKFPQIRKDRYDRAVAILNKINKGEMNIPGLPVRVNEEGSKGGGSTFSLTSNPKRENHFN